MENKNLKNIFIAAGLAVFAGVLTLGVNAAFGLDAPSQDPAGAALHSPVFNEVDVQGGLKNTIGNEIFVLDPIKALSGIIVEPTWGITALGNLGKVIIQDNLFVAGHNAGNGGYGIHINGNKGEITSDSGTVIVNSSLNTKGDLTISGALSLSKDLFSFAGATFLGDVIEQGDLIVTGTVSTGNSLFTDAIEGFSGGVAAEDFAPITFKNPIKGLPPAGLVSPITLKVLNNLEVTGNLGVGTSTPGAKLEVNGGAGQSTAVNVYGPNAVSQSSTINLIDTNNYLKAIWGGNTVLRSWNGIDLQVNHSTKGLSINTAGHVTAAGGFGTVNHTIWGSGSNLAAGIAGSRSVTCPAGQVLLSCGYTNGSGVPINRVGFDDSNTCYVDAKNTTAEPVWFNAKAICLDPAN